MTKQDDDIALEDADVKELDVADADVLTLEPANPMRSARELLLKQFTREDKPTLWRHRGCFWLWSGSCYQIANDETIRAQVWPLLEKAKRRKLNEDSKKWELVDFKPKSAHVVEVISALTAICQLDEHTNPPTWLSKDASKPPANEFLACANGLLHLPSGKLHRATPDYFCLTASEVMYEPKAKAPQWDAFLRELLGKDRQAVEATQDWFGYTLSPDTSLQKIMGVIGPPRSGKGTIARILAMLLGTASVAGPSMNSLGEWFGLEPLITKALAIISDVRIGSRTDKSTLVERLLSISGEDRLTVPRKFLAAWHGKLPVRVMFLTNELPALTDGSGAFASRLILVILTKSFLGKEDPQLTDKLANELSGILNWGIAGYRRLKQRGRFIQPESSREAVEDIETLGSPVKAFVRERCLVGPGRNYLFDNTFHAWIEWCNDENREPGNKEWFGRNLNAAVPGLRISRPIVNGKQVRIYEGIEVREEYTPTVMVQRERSMK
jgi:putative DNA primase/helicase